MKWKNVISRFFSKLIFLNVNKSDNRITWINLSPFYKNLDVWEISKINYETTFKQCKSYFEITKKLYVRIRTVFLWCFRTNPKTSSLNTYHPVRLIKYVTWIRFEIWKSFSGIPKRMLFLKFQSFSSTSSLFSGCNEKSLICFHQNYATSMKMTKDFLLFFTSFKLYTQI